MRVPRMTKSNSRRSQSLAALLVAFVLGVCFAVSAQEIRHGNGNGMVPNGKGQGVDNPNAPAEQSVPDNAKKGEQKPTGQAQTNGIQYHGGPVMLGTVNVYYIWYGNWSGNTATSILPTLVSDLGGS